MRGDIHGENCMIKALLYEYNWYEALNHFVQLYDHTVYWSNILFT